MLQFNQSAYLTPVYNQQSQIIRQVKDKKPKPKTKTGVGKEQGNANRGGGREATAWEEISGKVLNGVVMNQQQYYHIIKMSTKTIEEGEGTVEKAMVRRRCMTRGKKEVEGVATKAGSGESKAQQPKSHLQEGQNVRRSTRAYIACCVADSDPQLLTPDHPITPDEQRTVHLARADCKRGSLKNIDLQSPYVETRKSYRKAHRKEMHLIPFRKCYDQFEGRIVNILNKILNERSCAKDLDGLVDRMQKMTAKELLNKYIVSGIQTIVRLVQQKMCCSLEVSVRLREELGSIRQHVRQELMRDDQYCLITKEEQKEMDARNYRCQVIKTVYRRLKKQKPYQSYLCLKKQCMHICQEFFHDYHASFQKTIGFIRKLQPPQ